MAICCLFLLTGCGNEVLQGGDFDYKVFGNSAEIVKYNGSEPQPLIPSEIEGKTVTAIGSEAFRGNFRIEKIVIPEGVESIGDYAFETCSKLTQAVVPGSVKSIGKGAFSGCVALTDVSLTDGVESFGDGAFFFCRNLASFTMPQSAKRVGNFVFAECSKLSDVNLGGSLKNIGDRMFWGCSSLSALDIPASVETIGARAFEKCEALVSVTDAAGVESIGDRAFAGCWGLSAFVLPEGIKSVGDGAFSFCGGIPALNIPASLCSIGDGAFANISADSVTVSPENEYFTAENNVIFSKDMTELYFYAPNDAKTSYAVPSSITKIMPYAFAGCVNLEGISLPASLAEIGEYAFKDTTSLVTLTVPASVGKLGGKVMSGCGADVVTLEEGITAIGENNFSSSYSVVNVVIPKSVKEIGKFAFAGAQGLSSLTIPGTVEKIEPTALMNVECPVSIEPGSFTIRNGALYTADMKTLVKCLSESDVVDFVVPEGVSEICEYAFCGKDMKSITVPASVKRIGSHAFGYASDYSESGIDSSPIIGFNVYAPENSAAAKYASKNDLGCFTSEPAQTAFEVTLAGNESFLFGIPGAIKSELAYTSGDPSVASVDKNGLIIAHKTGETSVIAATGTTYFKCDVTVTSDGKPNKHLFDASGYTTFEPGDTAEWVENYIVYNKDSVSFDRGDNTFADAYKSENYYEGMWAAQVEGSEYDALATQMFGEGYFDQFAMMGHGLDAELSRYSQPDSIVLYSGTDSFERFLGGKPENVKNMQSMIGAISSEPYFFSTALDHSVAQNFSGKKNCVFEIYADKSLVNGGYIESTVGQGDGGEFELLLPAGTSFEVIDAGVREVTVTPLKENRNVIFDINSPDPYAFEFEDSVEAVPKMERYMKVVLVDGSKAEKDKGVTVGVMAMIATAAVVGAAALLNRRERENAK